MDQHRGRATLRFPHAPSMVFGKATAGGTRLPQNGNPRSSPRRAGNYNCKRQSMQNTIQNYLKIARFSFSPSFPLSPCRHDPHTANLNGLSQEDYFKRIHILRSTLFAYDHQIDPASLMLPASPLSLACIHGLVLVMSPASSHEPTS